MASDKGTNFLAGAVIGAAIAGGFAFLFGTDKGRQIRRRIYEEYPELFDKAGEGLNKVSSGTQKVIKENVKGAGKATENLGKSLQKAVK